MSATPLVAEIDTRFSSPAANPTSWSVANDALASAEVHWLSSIGPADQPHVTTIAGLWLDESFYFCTGTGEQKAKNLARNPQCAVNTGCNSFTSGLDVVHEGEARLVTGESLLQALADAYCDKYDGFIDFEVRNGAFFSEEGGTAIVYRLDATRAFGFSKEASFSQTRWTSE
jgi:nitroimidazol reductase NimA-like FMN-containing flavoprotein (pyridoxamine 5'-phosphate oxidase superfamily)